MRRFGLFGSKHRIQPKDLHAIVVTYYDYARCEGLVASSRSSYALPGYNMLQYLLVDTSIRTSNWNMV